MIRRFKQTTAPPPGRKLVREWNGLRVKTLVEMRNGWMTIPAGTTGVVETSGGTGLKLTCDPCPHCGVSAHITRVRSGDVVVASALEQKK